jgi:hypothetical protein
MGHGMSVASDLLVLEGGVTMVVNILGVPERSVEPPQEINQLVNQEVASEVVSVNYKGG